MVCWGAAEHGHRPRELGTPSAIKQDSEEAVLSTPTPIRLIAGAVIAAAVLLAGKPAAADDGQALPDYALLDEALLRSVLNGFVDYDTLASDPALDRFISQLAAAGPEAVRNREERLAFYINSYNALSIRGILDGHSPRSAWSRRQFFKSITYTVQGHAVSLSELEHDHLRAESDPRIHFAIVCASLSCPRLSNRAYYPETIDRDLDRAARRFINDPARNRFDLARKTAWLSKIFSWYDHDFEQAAGSVQHYLSRYVNDAEVATALENGEFRLQFQDYDWNLNGVFHGNQQRHAGANTTDDH